MALDPNAPWSWVPDEWNAIDPQQIDPMALDLATTMGPRGQGPVALPPPPPPDVNPSVPIRERSGESARERQRVTSIGGANLADEIAQTPSGVDWPPAEWSPAPESGIETDAVSGADPRAGVADLVGGVRVDEQGEDGSIEGIGERGDIRASNAGGLPSIEDREQELTGIEQGIALANMPAEQQIIERAKIEGARQKFATARALDAADKAQRDAQDNARIYQDALKAANERTAQLDIEAKQLADTNPLDSISGTSKILGVLASFIGGFGMNKSGRNVGLEMVESIANDAAKQHAAKIQANAKSQAGAGEQAGRAADVYKAAETVRLATYDGAIKMLEAEVQNFDPRGSTALRVMNEIGQMRAKRAELAAKYRDDELKRAEGLLKEQRELTKLAEDQRHNLASEKNDATRAYADVLRAKADDKRATAEVEAPMSSDQLRSMGIAIPEDVQLPPMTVKRARQVAETAKSVEDWQKAARENSPAERNRELAIGEITDDQGEPIRFRGTDFAGKLANSKAAVDNAARLVDKLILARDKYGWSSDLLKSPEWREMQADYTALQLEKKNTDELGVLAGPDMALIEKSLGTSDPTELRDPTPGLKTARSNMVEQLNSKIRAQAVLPQGRNVKRYEPPDMTKSAPPVRTAGEATVQQVLTFDPKKGVRKGEGDFAQSTAAGDSYLPPEHKTTIDRLVDTFNNAGASEKDREQAGAFLEEIKSNAKSSVVRQYAIDRAASGVMSAIPATEEP